jgi:hypothetical protein
MRLTTHLHVVPRLRMSGAVPLSLPVCLHGMYRATLPLTFIRCPLCSDFIYINEIDLVIYNNLLITWSFSVTI